ncbi:RWD domain-containing protein 4 [Teleopsis dalmanni]|uniref:RWD domain-containing protein 4 n=1 Tax=Teleopsis dalmanni TaxID=139649 RepID=UPI0018CF6124|nr:RWD domain-containing protein 4 [Teleopsis dalmanni]XP_037958752.1 RWD domain-containing protein 4 [Teleopsis dalmanni]XP_037958753.1 RWD domain-containing protein 4 [Teleopsis dalmanni]
MSEQLEQQAEEREALQSIYEGDNAFKELDKATYQYKYGEDNDYKSFLVEIKWGENYPNELPEINMDTFYNRTLVSTVKEKIKAALLQEGELWIGCGMTYTLFECLKERIEELTADQPESSTAQAVDFESVGVSSIKISDNADTKKKEPKKEQLTKAQKRRQWERTDHRGDRPRGWDWVDIVKHLSQTGNKQDDSATTQNVVLQSLNS